MCLHKLNLRTEGCVLGGRMMYRKTIILHNGTAVGSGAVSPKQEAKGLSFPRYLIAPFRVGKLSAARGVTIPWSNRPLIRIIFILDSQHNGPINTYSPRYDDKKTRGPLGYVVTCQLTRLMTTKVELFSFAYH